MMISLVLYGMESEPREEAELTNEILIISIVVDDVS